MRGYSLHLVPLLLLLLSVLATASLHSPSPPRASENDDYYVAAVVEFAGVYNYDPAITKRKAQDVMMANMDSYETFVVQAKQQGAQIILFPEDGLYGAAFETAKSIFPYMEVMPEVDVVPCSEPTKYSDSPVILRASCMAIKYNIIVAFNMGEYCANNGTQYNTNVVFDEQGRLVMKYHKSHLYFEPQFNSGNPNNAPYFDSSFGVRFGSLVCFDIMFSEPQSQLLYSLNISGLLWPNWWVNFPPMITGTQFQQSWALQSGISLLAAGSAGGSFQSSGSGLYGPGGEIIASYSNLNRSFSSPPQSKLLVGRLPKKTSPSASFRPHISSSSWSLQKAFADIDTFAYKTVEIAAGNTGHLEVSSGPSLVCSVDFVSSSSNTQPEQFALLALQGRYHGIFLADICAFMRCPDAATNCTSFVTDSRTAFQSFTLTANGMNSDAQPFPMVAINNADIVDPSLWSLSALSSTAAASPYMTKAVTLTSTQQAGGEALNASPFLNAAIFAPNWSNS